MVSGVIASRRDTVLEKPAFHLLFIAVITALVYSNTLYSPFVFDDYTNIVENPIIKNLSFYLNPSQVESLRDTFAYTSYKSRYIGSLSFALNYDLHGLEVTGYHITNILIHVLNSFLVYLLVVISFRTPLLIRSPLHAYANRIALFSALLFACHPVQTQSVTYIVQRYTSLATLFYMLALLSYSAWRQRLLQKEDSAGAESVLNRSLIFYLMSIAASILAMKTKQIAFTLPVVIILYEFMFFEGTMKSRFLSLSPHVLTMLIIPFSLLDLGRPVGEIIDNMNDTTRIVKDISRWDYLFTEFRVVVTYLRLIVLPINQNLDYDYPIYRSFFDPPVLLSFLLHAILFLSAVYLLRRSRNSAAGLRLISFGIFWFFIALSVESSVIPLHAIFEHRIYLPSIGFFMAFTGLIFTVQDNIRKRWPFAVKALAPALLLIVLAFSAATYARNQVWKDTISLWEDVVKKSPMKARGYNNLGVAYARINRIGMAIEMSSKAIEVDPEYEESYNNLGSLYDQTGQVDKAIALYKKAIAINPNYGEAYNNLGNAYGKKGQPELAIAMYDRALEINSIFVESYFNRGNIYLNLGHYNKAIADYSSAIALNPLFDIAYHNRGQSYYKKGQVNEAIAEYTKAISINPDFFLAFLNRGLIFLKFGQFDQAIQDFTNAIALNPFDMTARMRRGFAYAEQGRMTQAQADLQKACEMGSIVSCDALRGFVGN